MEFTYRAYRELIHILKDRSYQFTSYDCTEYPAKCVIMRHDIDFSVDKALRFAQLENDEGICTTYFALVSTNFYNISERNIKEKLIEISKLGHDIGLHFDETNYNKDISFYDAVFREKRIMEEILQLKIKSISMHRPSKETLDSEYEFEGKLINSYSTRFLHEFKYVSDSRMAWREDPVSVVRDGIYSQIHILTHPFWYNKENIPLSKQLYYFINQAREERHRYLESNIRDLESALKGE